jgi:streptogramin lyase/4-amino-4-deoxy-L-arabinose transferase-like glycosyltransferase
LGIIALFLIIVGLVQVRNRVWLDAGALTGAGLLLWLWSVGRVSYGNQRLVGPVALRFERGWLGALLALGALGVAVWRWRVLDVEHATDADWLWYVGTISLIVLAAVVTESQWPRTIFPFRMGGMFWAFVAVVLVATIVRFLLLESLPFGTWYDEAANGLESLRMVREPAYRPIYTDGVNSTGHYLWLIAGAFKLFGENTFAVRSISAAMGIATVIAAYFAGRELFGPTFGLFWASLFAVARWSLTFSRLGMYNSATPLFEVLALLWLLRGLRRGSPLDFALAGVTIGLGLCFYSAFQLFGAVLAIIVLVVGWQERSHWRTLVGGLSIALIATLIVIAPVVKYAVYKPESYFARVQVTSLFTGKLPEERLPALLENTRKHLLMFNVAGDPNGRHNLPGEPMLDWISGGLLVAGLAICVQRGRKPRTLLIPVWIVIPLLGGILSLDFEAPQSLRSIGSLPAVLLAAAIPPTILVEEWRRGSGRYFPHIGLWVVAALLILPASVANMHIYFGRQARDFASWNAHSTPETIAAHLLRDAPPSVEKYVISLFDGHPTVRFLAQGVQYRRVETNMTLPLLREMPDGMLLILDGERRLLFEEARRLYPNAQSQEINSPFGGPSVVYVNKVSPGDLQSIQGLTASYRRAEIDAFIRKDVAIDFTWPEDAPVALPFETVWSGVLAANTYGPYQFFVEAPGRLELRIGETVVISGNASEVEGLGGGIMLARGHHTISLSAQGGEGRIRLVWQPPDGPPATVPSWALYVPPVQSNGLLGRYFGNGEWSGEPAFAQIDPRLSVYFHVPTLARPYTVEWSGKLAIPEGGRYDFALHSIDESSLLIDGVEVVQAIRNQMAVGGVELEAGLHDIIVRYADRTDHTFINLSWRPPGGDAMFRTIPSELFFPPQASYAQVDVGNLARFVQSETQAPVNVVREQIDPAVVEVIIEGLAQPRGVALLAGVVYVAEAGIGRIIALDATSGELVPSPLAEQSFVEPFDLAAQRDGTLSILDAGAGALFRFDPATGLLTTLPVPTEYGDRARGIGAGLSGETWIASTPGQRIVAVDSNGLLIQEIVLPRVTIDNKEMQPTDVVMMSDNTLYATDVAEHILYRFDVAGFLLASQPIPVANSLDSSHLATDKAGMLYMTEPEAGRIVQFDASGVPVAAWSVRVAGSEDAKPVGLDVDADGTIWVVDSVGGRLLRVTPETSR